MNTFTDGLVLYFFGSADSGSFSACKPFENWFLNDHEIVLDVIFIIIQRSFIDIENDRLRLILIVCGAQQRNPFVSRRVKFFSPYAGFAVRDYRRLDLVEIGDLTVFYSSMVKEYASPSIRELLEKSGAK